MYSPTSESAYEEIEIIQATPDETAARDIRSSDSVTKGSPFGGYVAGLAALILAIGFLMTRGSDGGSETENAQNQTPATTLPTIDNGGSINSAAVSDGSLGSENETLPHGTTTKEWDGGLSLIVVENPQFIYEVDLATGRRTSWAPPDLLVDTDPLVIGDEVVVITESGAWIGQPFSYSWRFLAEADQVLPSSDPGRMWLQTNPTAAGQTAPRVYQWVEVDAVGRQYRTVESDSPVHGLTPELAMDPDGGILRLTVSELSPWTVLSETGKAVATGLNDIVVWECDQTDECQRHWYDPTTSRTKRGFFPDLAQNVDVEFGSLLSADGRFMVAKPAGDQTEVMISSVANGREIENLCVWNQSIVWSSGSKLLACATDSGAQLINTESGESLGMVVGPDADWARMAFMTTARIAQLR